MTLTSVKDTEIPPVDDLNMHYDCLTRNKRVTRNSLMSLINLLPHLLSGFQLVKMVIIVATLYAVSQLPRHVVYLVTLNNADAFRQETMMYIWLFCQLCTWSATCYNPFIYSWMNRTFRRGMVDLLRRALCLRQFRILSRLSRRGTQSPDTFMEFDPMITQANSLDKEDKPVEMEKYS
ncbi:hypothetical protein X801_00911 [Opisthorchis viverrini]|uniref:G-protein coupled receptors family 1 profile domain-containing protein n=1 Tax=Opisthorchis viverrini TaxID=6198 RepID=A0A1S8X924_OPIVI|nr:hypothetical protein X801_00911 [Opisthorchis viverrini]